jgi:hypothetical protein
VSSSLARAVFMLLGFTDFSPQALQRFLKTKWSQDDCGTVARREERSRLSLDQRLCGASSTVYPIGQRLPISRKISFTQQKPRHLRACFANPFVVHTPVTRRSVIIQSAAMDLRSRCGSVLGRPVLSSHFSPGAAPQIGHRTASAVRFIQNNLA